MNFAGLFFVNFRFFSDVFCGLGRFYSGFVTRICQMSSEAAVFCSGNRSNEILKEQAGFLVSRSLTLPSAPPCAESLYDDIA